MFLARGRYARIMQWFWRVYQLGWVCLVFWAYTDGPIERPEGVSGLGLGVVCLIVAWFATQALYWPLYWIGRLLPNRHRGYTQPVRSNRRPL